jgi:hypothetical protein
MLESPLVEPTFTSKSAKAFLVDQLRAQAALESVSFSQLEMKLLLDEEERPDPSIDDAELDEFENEHREEFFGRVEGLLKRARKRFERENPGHPDFAEALVLAAENEDYFAIVLWDKFFLEISNPQLPQTWTQQLRTLGIALVLCVPFIAGIFYLLDNGERLQAGVRDFLSRHPTIANIRMPHIAWLQDPNGWFQQNGGKYFLIGVITLGMVFWGRLLARWVAKRSAPGS